MQPIHVCNHTTPEAIYPFDARGVAKATLSWQAVGPDGP